MTHLWAHFWSQAALALAYSIPMHILVLSSLSLSVADVVAQELD